MLVVLDTNVIISALYSKNGASFQLLNGILSGSLPWAISPLLALEYEGKIHEKIAAGFLKVSEENCERILDALFAMGRTILRPVQIRPSLQDLTDDKVFECAVSGNCTHIITFNKKDFPPAVTQPYGIRVMTPGELLQIWRCKR